MEDSRNLLKQHNLKITSARISILNFLNESIFPVDILSIADALKRNNISADSATIFRIMNIFRDEGIVKQIQLNEGKSRYELSSRPEHHHIVCTNCGAIDDIEVCIDDSIEKKVIDKTGYLITSHSMEFQGICPTCQKDLRK